MDEICYQEWLNIVSALFLMLAVVLTLLTTVRVKNKIDKRLLQIFFFGFYAWVIRVTVPYPRTETYMSGSDVAVFMYESLSSSYVWNTYTLFFTWFGGLSALLIFIFKKIFEVYKRRRVK